MMLHEVREHDQPTVCWKGPDHKYSIHALFTGLCAKIRKVFSIKTFAIALAAFFTYTSVDGGTANTKGVACSLYR